MGCSRCQRRAVRCQPYSWMLTVPLGMARSQQEGQRRRNLSLMGTP